MAERTDYKSTWMALSDTRERAMLHVGGETTEEGLMRWAEADARNIDKAVGFRRDDDVVEIGCGVGRLGKVVAPRARTWVGCDVSPSMLDVARDRLHGLANVELQEVSGYDLAPLGDGTATVVYAAVLFMHLDEWDRFGYVEEAYRLLRPGGRFWCNGLTIATDEGWAIFQTHRKTFPRAPRPSHVSTSSSPSELATYLKRVGFTDIGTCEHHMWVEAWGVKP